MDKLELAVEKMAKITAKMKADKTEKETIKEKHKGAKTTNQRLDRIEEVLGIKI